MFHGLTFPLFILTTHPFWTIALVFTSILYWPNWRDIISYTEWPTLSGSRTSPFWTRRESWRSDLVCRIRASSSNLGRSLCSWSSVSVRRDPPNFEERNESPLTFPRGYRNTWSGQSHVIMIPRCLRRICKIPTRMSSRLNVFQLGLGCLRRNLMAVMSCHGARLSDEWMTQTSWDPYSECGSGIRTLLCRLTTQSDNDFELVTAN